MQVYLLLSCCPCEGRLSGIVDVPNAVCTLAIPTAIFDQDIRPKKGRVPTPGVSLRTSPADVAKSTHDGTLPITRCLCHSAGTLPPSSTSGSGSVDELDAGQVAGAKPSGTDGSM